MLLGAEPHRPYERPGLSKGYLQGQMPRAELRLREHSVLQDKQSTCDCRRRWRRSIARLRPSSRRTALVCATTVCSLGNGSRGAPTATSPAVTSRRPLPPHDRGRRRDHAQRRTRLPRSRHRRRLDRGRGRRVTTAARKPSCHDRAWPGSARARSRLRGRGTLPGVAPRARGRPPNGTACHRVPRSRPGRGRCDPGQHAHRGRPRRGRRRSTASGRSRSRRRPRGR